MEGQLGSHHALKKIVQIVKNNYIRYSKVQHSQFCLCISNPEGPMTSVTLRVSLQWQVTELGSVTFAHRPSTSHWGSVSLSILSFTCIL